MRKRAIIAVAWVAVGVWDAGTMNASFRAEFADLAQDPRWTRQNLAVAIFVGVGGLLGAPATFIATGAYQDGWSLDGSAVPCTSAYPAIYCGRNRP